MDRAPRSVRVLEADLLLGRMDIEIGERRIDLEEEESQGMEASGQEAREGMVERAEDGPVLHSPAVDESPHQATIRAREGRSRQDQVALEARSGEPDRMEELARRLGEEGAHPLEPRDRPQDGWGPRSGLESEGQGGMGRGLVLEGLSAERGLGLGSLQEAASGWEVLEQSRYRDAGPAPARAALDARGGPAGDEAMRGRRLFVLGDDLELRGCGYRGQGLSPEAETAGAQEVVGGLDLGRRVGKDGELEIGQGPSPTRRPRRR